VSDILTCPDEYRVALENYLEPVMNYHVVQTEAQAYEAINLLCEAGKGRPTSSCSTSWTPSGPRRPPLPPGADTVAAVAVAEFEPQYQNLVAHLLDNVYVLRHNPDPLPVVPRAVFLSQDGRCIGRPFSLSGGSVGLFEGKRIGRAKNLENLRKEIGRLQTALAEWQGRQREARALREELLTRRNALNVRIAQGQKEADVLSRELVTLRARQEQLALTVQNQTLRREDLLAQLEDLEETLAEVRPKQKPRPPPSGAWRPNWPACTRNWRRRMRWSACVPTPTTPRISAFTRPRTASPASNRNSPSSAIRLEKTAERSPRNAEELARAEADIAHLTETDETGDDQLADLYREKESVAAGLDEAEKDYYAARGRIDRLEKEARDLHRQRELTDALLLELQTKLNETRLQLSSVKERLSVQFNVDLDEIMNEGDGDRKKQLRITNDELREDRQGDWPAGRGEGAGTEGPGRRRRVRWRRGRRCLTPTGRVRSCSGRWP
jgi:chromosome segregation protein